MLARLEGAEKADSQMARNVRTFNLIPSSVLPSTGKLTLKVYLLSSQL